MDDRWFLIFADLLLILHTLLVAFVILGLAAIFVGYVRKWQWVRNVWFWPVGFWSGLENEESAVGNRSAAKMPLTLLVLSVSYWFNPPT